MRLSAPCGGAEGGRLEQVNPRPLEGANETATPWLTVKGAAARARCGVKTIYREVQQKRLRAARVGGRRELRFLATWIDSWLEGTAA